MSGGGDLWEIVLPLVLMALIPLILVLLYLTGVFRI